MKRNKNAYWYQLGYISRDREENPVFIRYCKNPRGTREHKHLMKQLDRREIYGVFYRPFDPEIQGVDAYEIKMNETNY
jgi:hypothetical protein